MIDEAWIKELREVKRTHSTDHLHQPAPVPHDHDAALAIHTDEIQRL